MGQRSPIFFLNNALVFQVVFNGCRGISHSTHRDNLVKLCFVDFLSIRAFERIKSAINKGLRCGCFLF